MVCGSEERRDYNVSTLNNTRKCQETLSVYLTSCSHSTVADSEHKWLGLTVYGNSLGVSGVVPGVIVGTEWNMCRSLSTRELIDTRVRGCTCVCSCMHKSVCARNNTVFLCLSLQQ